VSGRRLRVGEVVRLSPGGPEYKVARVNACAAYLRRASAEGKVVTIGERTFLAHEEGGQLAVAPTSFVYREEGK
jgi:hypothetical protein